MAIDADGRQRTIYAAGRTPRGPRRRDPRNPGFERFMWYFMRISGLLLVILALGHMIIMHVARASSPGRRSTSPSSPAAGEPRSGASTTVLLLVLALVHGVNGARIVIGDFVRARRAAEPS